MHSTLMSCDGQEVYSRRSVCTVLTPSGAGVATIMVPPGLTIAWGALGLTLLGNGLERVFNPRLELHHLSVGPKMVARFKPLPPVPAVNPGGGDGE